MQKYPLPNQPMTNGNNWSASIPSPVYWRQENIRGDFNLNKDNTFMGRYTQDSWTNNTYQLRLLGRRSLPGSERQLGAALQEHRSQVDPDHWHDDGE